MRGRGVRVRAGLRPHAVPLQASAPRAARKGLLHRAKGPTAPSGAVRRYLARCITASGTRCEFWREPGVPRGSAPVQDSGADASPRVCAPARVHGAQLAAAASLQRAHHIGLRGSDTRLVLRDDIMTTIPTILINIILLTLIIF